jgi:hypothetical protein
MDKDKLEDFWRDIRWCQNRSIEVLLTMDDDDHDDDNDNKDSSVDEDSNLMWQDSMSIVNNY